MPEVWLYPTLAGVLLACVVLVELRTARRHAESLQALHEQYEALIDLVRQAERLRADGTREPPSAR